MEFFQSGIFPPDFMLFQRDFVLLLLFAVAATGVAAAVGVDAVYALLVLVEDVVLHGNARASRAPTMPTTVNTTLMTSQMVAHSR